jgi:hypothetical protein
MNVIVFTNSLGFEAPAKADVYLPLRISINPAIAFASRNSI